MPPDPTMRALAPDTAGETAVLLSLCDQLCAFPVEAVRDVLGEQVATAIPLAPPEIAGAINLRGRIVTVIDLRLRLGLPPRPDGAPAMHVVSEAGGALYALRVDHVSEVVRFGADALGRTPDTLPPALAGLSLGVARHDGRLVLRLDGARLLGALAETA